MKQKVEEILDSLIIANRIETPDWSNFFQRLRQTGKTLLLAAGVVAVAVAGTVLLPHNITVSSSTVDGRELPIYSVETKKPQVALTFDAAWGNEDMAEILKILDAHDVKVTFFVTGGWVKNFPEDVKKILAAGHELGNHGENHKHMSQLTNKEIKEEMMALHNRVEELTGYKMFLFRPPYGDYDNAVVKTSYQCGYYPIQWDVDSLDWKDYGVNAIVKTVLENSNLGNGSIILCHNGSKFTAQALDTLITGIKEKGYELVPVSELIYRDNYNMDHEGRQIQNSKE